MKKNKVMDWTTFIGSSVILLIAVIPMMVFPKASQEVITKMNDAVSSALGSVYLFIGLAILIFVLYIAFGKYGNVTLGKATDKPEFNNFSWAAMLFCAGIASDILYWGIIEWAFYYQDPPHGGKGMTDSALNYATMYGMFHWGPIAWATFVLPALCIGGRKETNFPQQWTIFYWSWWIVYAPFIGLFIARISKGRTLKEVVLGTIIYGTLGCMLFFGIFGNYAVFLQISGQFDVIQNLNTHGTEATIIEVLHQLPFHNIIIVLFMLSAVLFLATTFDSGSYILAAASQKKVIGEPLKANRLYWAFALCLLPFALMLVGGEKALEVLKTAALLASVPVLVVFVMMMVAFMRTLNEDRLKLESRADKYREVERRSLRITQVREQKEDDNL
ncbi:BCCT family transporter [Staphylococcus saprophyticus]|nr:BCCT family transporter [Staphylococcus saprophyticus]